MKIFLAVFFAVLLFLILKVLRLGLKRLLNRYSIINYTDNIFVASELIFWLIYSFWAISFLFRDKFYYSYLVYAMILIITVLLVWFLLIDIFAGIMFRIRHNLRTGSYIRTGNISGQIKSQQLTYLKIQTDDGQILRIPYSRIIRDVITERAYKGTLAEHIIHIKVDASLAKPDAESLIRSAILNIPWSNLKEEPLIKYQKEDKNGYYFELTLLSKNMSHMKFIKMALEEISHVTVI